MRSERDASLDFHPHRGWESTSTSGGALSCSKKRPKGKEQLILLRSERDFKLFKLFTPEG